MRQMPANPTNGQSNDKTPEKLVINGIKIPNWTDSDSHSWARELGESPRFARLPEDEIAEEIRACRSCDVSIRTTPMGVKIVLDFPTRSLSNPVSRLICLDKETFLTAFEVALGEKAAKNLCRAELENAAAATIEATWRKFLAFRFARRGYSGVTAYHEQVWKRIQAKIGRKPPGKKATGLSKEASLRRRCKRLEVMTTELHAAAEQLKEAIFGYQTSHRLPGSPIKILRQLLYDRYGLKISSTHREAIFGETAFQMISSKAFLDSTEKWKPRQLAVALLALEESVEYSWMARIVGLSAPRRIRA
jgi:hypothetical protein